MIVLTEEQKQTVLAAKDNHADILFGRNVDLMPIAIKNGLYILPEDLLQDENFAELHDVIIDNSIIREVSEDELIKE